MGGSIWIDEVSFAVRDGQPVCMLRSGTNEFELRGKPETLHAGIASATDTLREFHVTNGAQANRAELAVVPLCQLCIRHDLPKD